MELFAARVDEDFATLNPALVDSVGRVNSLRLEDSNGSLGSKWTQTVSPSVPQKNLSINSLCIQALLLYDHSSSLMIL